MALYRSLLNEGSSADDFAGAIGAALAQHDAVGATWLEAGLRKYPRDARILNLAGQQAAQRGDYARAERYLARGAGVKGDHTLVDSRHAGSGSFAGTAVGEVTGRRELAAGASWVGRRRARRFCRRPRRRRPPRRRHSRPIRFRSRREARRLPYGARLRRRIRLLRGMPHHMRARPPWRPLIRRSRSCWRIRSASSSTRWRAAMRHIWRRCCDPGAGRTVRIQKRERCRKVRLKPAMYLVRRCARAWRRCR